MTIKSKEQNIDEQNLIMSLIEKIKTLEAKVKRLQQAKLDKFASMFVQGMLSNPNEPDVFTSVFDDVSEYAIRQAKSLINALNEEGDK